MDEALAEIALLTLSARLTWAQESEHRWDSQKIEVGWFYTIVSEPGRRSRFTAQLDAFGDIDWSPEMFTTLADAKAACERHFTTGNWEVEALDITRFSLTVTGEAGGTPLQWYIWVRIGNESAEMHCLCGEGNTADDARASLTAQLLARGWTQQNCAEFFARANSKM